MNYPGTINKTYNKITNYANRGMDLENLINQSNDYYLSTNRAVIHKKPTPIQVVNTKFDQNKKIITEAYFKEASTLDYNGLYKGYYVDFDAKETKNKTSFPLQNLHQHQYEHMIKIIDNGGISFLIIAMNNTFYYLDGHDIKNFIQNNQRKSIPLSYLEDKGYIIEKKINPRLDYLRIIDILYFEGDVYGYKEKKENSQKA